MKFKGLQEVIFMCFPSNRRSLVTFPYQSKGPIPHQKAGNSHGWASKFHEVVAIVIILYTIYHILYTIYYILYIYIIHYFILKIFYNQPNKYDLYNWFLAQPKLANLHRFTRNQPSRAFRVPGIAYSNWEFAQVLRFNWWLVFYGLGSPK